MHAPRPSLAFRTRIAFVSIFVLGLLASFAPAEAASKSNARSMAPMRQAIAKPVISRPSNNVAPRFNPGSNTSPRAVNTDTVLPRRDVYPAPPNLTKLPSPYGSPIPVQSPPGAGIVRDPGGNGAPATLPTPSASDRNRQFGACLVGIASACNGNAANGGGPKGGGDAGNTKGGGGRVPASPAPGGAPPSNFVDAGSGGGGGGGSGFSFSPSFSFGGGSGDSGTQTAAATANDPATAVCVADPTDVYKRLECNIADFKAGKIERAAFEANKSAALALLDPEKLGSDLVFRALRELVDLNLITAEDRDAQKRLIVARL